MAKTKLFSLLTNEVQQGMLHVLVAVEKDAINTGQTFSVAEKRSE